MPLDETTVRNFDFADVPVKMHEKDAMLYALGLGIGVDPLDARALRHVYEKDLQVFPTMPLVLGSPGNVVRQGRSGLPQAGARGAGVGGGAAVAAGRRHGCQLQSRRCLGQGRR